MQGAKVALIANGVGPIRRKCNRLLTTKILNQVDLITVRERFSYNFLKELPVNHPNIHITGDPVFLTEPTEDSHLFDQEGILRDEDYVCVMFRPWESAEKYTPKIAEICDRIIKTYGYKVVFVPMRFSEDRKIAESIVERMKPLADGDRVVIIQKHAVTDIIALVRRAKFTLGMRLHAIIYSAISGTPFIAFNYDPKIVYYAEELGMPLVEDLSRIDIPEVMGMIDRIVRRREEFTRTLKENTEIIQEKALQNTDYLEQILL